MAQKKSSKKKASQTSSKNQSKSRYGISAEMMVFLLTLFAVLQLIGWFVREGEFLKWAHQGFLAILGPGAYTVPFVMLLTALYLLLTLRKKKNVRWLVSLWMLPVWVGMVGHLILSKTSHGWELLPYLQDGMQYLGGGLISGGLTELFSAGISKVGTAVLLAAALFFLSLGITNQSFASLMEKLHLRLAAAAERKREEYQLRRMQKEQEEEEEPDAIPMPVSKPKIDIPLSGARQIDIPLDDTQESEVFEAAPAVPVAVMDPEPEGIEEPAKASKKSSKPSMSREELEEEIAQVQKEADLPPPAYQFPPVTLLKTAPPLQEENVEAEIRQNAERLLQTLHSFNLEAKIINVTRGPSVTRYEIQLSSGIKFSRLTSLSDDIALSLAAQSVRIAPIPHTSAIGIEVPNKLVNTVYIRDIIQSSTFANASSKVTFALGQDIAGSPVVGDIAKLPHLLVAGTTGSGKSVCINSVLISLLYKARPDEVRFIMIDPKMVELNGYNGIPHLLIPVVTDPKKAAGALQWAVMEMLQRYERFKAIGVRNFVEYNAEVQRQKAERDKVSLVAAALEESGEEDMPPFDIDEETHTSKEETPVLEELARIVIVIDELVDLMLAAPGEVEEAICRIAQMARAAGMHLIIATQRPSADVITGLMKANIPSRIAFSVASSLESRIILDQAGAEKLLGRGDMLFSPIGINKPIRIQGCFISDSEIEAVVSYIKKAGSAQYSEEIMMQIEQNAAETGKGKKKGDSADGADDSETDELFDQAVEVVLETGQPSVSLLQRRLKLGYARAARVIDQMEERGIVGPFEGSKPRQLLITKEDWAEILYRRTLE